MTLCNCNEIENEKTFFGDNVLLYTIIHILRPKSLSLQYSNFQHYSKFTHLKFKEIRLACLMKFEISTDPAFRYGKTFWTQCMF